MTPHSKAHALSIELHMQNKGLRDGVAFACRIGCCFKSQVTG